MKYTNRIGIVFWTTLLVLTIVGLPGTPIFIYSPLTIRILITAIASIWILQILYRIGTLEKVHISDIRIRDTYIAMYRVACTIAVGLLVFIITMETTAYYLLSYRGHKHLLIVLLLIELWRRMTRQ